MGKFVGCAVLACTLLAIVFVRAAHAATPPSDRVPPAILALDFGSEWLKGCLANQASSSIGTHLDVVINEQSNRKTPNVIGFDNEDERILGDSALPLLFRSPGRVFPQVKRLLGRTLQDPLTQQYLSDFSQLQLLSDSERETILFKKKDGDLSVEEIVVMLLQMAKRQAENHVAANAEPEDIQPVNDVVLTVPEYFTSAQRVLLEQMVQLAGFNKPKATLNELTAVAVDYAVRNLQPGTKSKVAFLGAGTMGVSANVVEMDRSEDGISLKVLKSASDPSLGGYSFDVVLRESLAKKFDATFQKGGASITSNPRAMAKLLRESRELKEMLSVSPIIEVNMEELFNGKDFKTSTTQDEFIALTAELADKMNQPLKTVLAGLDGVTGIEVFGGSVRIPSVQNAIKAAFPEIVLGKHVDGEEAVVLGAAHVAGVLTNIAKLVKVNVDETAVTPLRSAADEKLILSPAQQETLATKIRELDAKAEARRAADAARNGLESLLNDARDLVSKVPKGKKAEGEALEAGITAASTFVDDSDKSTTQSAFESERAKLAALMEPLKIPKKVEPLKVEKPSPPKKKRDRRAEYKKAQEDAAKRAKEDEKKKKLQEEKAKKEKEAAAAKKKKAEDAKKKETKGKKPAKDEL